MFLVVIIVKEDKSNFKHGNMREEFCSFVNFNAFNGFMVYFFNESKYLTPIFGFLFFGYHFIFCGNIALLANLFMFRYNNKFLGICYLILNIIIYGRFLS